MLETTNQIFKPLFVCSFYNPSRTLTVTPLLTQWVTLWKLSKNLGRLFSGQTISRCYSSKLN